MIKLQRQSLNEPNTERLLAPVLRAIRAYYSLPTDQQLQSRIDLRDLNRYYNQIRKEVARVSYEKCAYCEVQIFGQPGDVAPFRPKAAASDLSGAGSASHYGWLSADWENLYLCCADCNRFKRNLFPVQSDVRATQLLSIEAVRGSERALLIDPGFDDPSEHLQFLPDGTVIGLTEIGHTTITVLGLNVREYLIKQRRQAYESFNANFVAWLNALRQSQGDRASELLERLQAATLTQPHAAAGRAAAAEAQQQLASLGIDFRFTDAVPTANAPPSLKDKPVLKTGELARLQSRPIQRIEIRNFRAVRDLTLELPVPGSDPPWLVLLGENATGKSSVLLAVALTLAGAQIANLQSTPLKVLRKGAKTGYVKLFFWDNAEPAVITFTAGAPQFGGTSDISALVLAYGALRIPGGRRRAPGPTSTPRAHIAGITRDVARLPNPLSWLLSLSQEHFDATARVLRTALLVQGTGLMTRTGRRVAFNLTDGRASLDQLSAGYRTVVGIVCDALSVLFTRWDLPESAEGFVIIDELESHLHPRWKMRVVHALREAFPKVQFLISTHDPLVLRGVRNGEVRLMQHHPERGVVSISNLPGIEGLRVDQLLTSDFFGLSSTLDPDMEADFQRYYDLLSRTDLSFSEEADLAEIRVRLSDKRQLGSTRRERLMLEAIDRFLASKEPDNDTPYKLDAEMRTRLQALWDGP